MKRKRKFVVFNIIALSLLAFLGGILESLASSIISSTYLQFVWPALGVVALAIVGLSVWQYRLQEASEQIPPNIQNRLRLIEKVRSFWIKGVLEQSLHNEALIVLGLHMQPDAVANPWHLVLQLSGEAAYPLPMGTRITDVYDDAGGELLILGEPGSGKTTLLLELARNLLNRAQKDDKLQIPVILNLSSWAVKSQPIDEWLVEELNIKYQVPRKLGQSWVEGDQILPLLDGLDEVKSEYRENCLKAINDYRRNHGIVPIVVCSRISEYRAQKQRILMRTAVVVQPLSESQIDDYLASADEQLAAIRIALHRDAALKEICTTPLMLSVLTLAYQGVSIEDIMIGSSPEKYRQQVFESYVQRMILRRGTQTHYTKSQITYWLSWLASQLIRHNQTEFYIERMQSNWLPPGQLRQLFQFITLKTYLVIIGFLLGVFVGSTFGSILGYILTSFRVPFGQWIFLAVGLLGGILGAYLVKQANVGEDEEIKLGELVTWSWRPFWTSFWNVLRLLKPISILIEGLITGPFCIFLVLIGFKPLIRLFGWIKFFFEFDLKLGFISKPLGNVGFLLIFGLLIGLIIDFLFRILMLTLFGLSIGLLEGFKSEMLPERDRILPNQGIRNTAWNTILIGLLTGLMTGLVFGLAFGLVFSLLSGIIIGISSGLAFGIATALNNGADACLDHLVLRLIIWRANFAPLNYPRFLDYVTDCILLRKVGGSYIFIHRTLLEYFASLAIKPTANSLDEQK